MQDSRPGLLLFSEICLLAGMSGILAQRHLWPGLVCLALLPLLDLPRSGDAARSLALLLAFCMGLGYAALREERPPPVPDWLRAASCPEADARGEILPPGELRIAARVERSDYLPGNRLRVILGALRPADQPGEPGSAEAMNTAGGPEARGARGARAALPDAAAVYAGRCAWTWYRPKATVLPGSDILVTVRLAPQRGLANPGGLDIERYWRDRGVFFRAWSGAHTDFVRLPKQDGRDPVRSMISALAQKRHELRARFQAALPRDEQGRIRPSAAVLPALIFGDRSLLSPEQSDLFARSTLAHSLALSGLHMGFAVLVGALLAALLIRAAPRVALYLPRPKLAMLFSLPVALFYLWLGQAPPSLCRAACMLFFWTALLLMDRPRVLLDGLMAALAFLLLLDPGALFDLSLQLSALCVAVIALVAPHLAALGRRLFPGPIRGAPGRRTRLARAGLGILGISLAIQVTLLPLVLRAFGASGLLFPLNLLWLPLLSFAVLPLAFAALAVCAAGAEALAAALLFLGDAPGRGLLMLLEGLDKAALLPAPLLPRPHWLSMIGYWLLCLTLPALMVRLPTRMKSTSNQAASAAIKLQNQAASAAIKLWNQPASAAIKLWNQPASAALKLGNRPAFIRAFRLARPSLPDCLSFSSQPGKALALLGLFLLLAPLAVVLAGQQRPKVSLTLFDVGQGESLLISWQKLGRQGASGRALLDGGGFTSPFFDTGRAVLAPALTDQAPARLDMVLNSHPDTDHLGGLPYILERFRVNSYYGNGDRPTPTLEAREKVALERSGLEKQRLHAGRTLELAPDLLLECLWPPKEAPRAEPPGQEKGNNRSLALRLVWRGVPLALFCGDLETEALQALVAGTGSLAAQVLLLPHHGSSGSVLPALYDAAGPRLALASAGFGNRWGFPSLAARRALAERGVPLLDTGRAGRIVLTWDAPDNMAQPLTARP